MPQDVEINPVCKKKPFVLPHTVSLFWKYDQLSYTHFNFNFRKINYKCWNENKAEKSANTGNIIEINLNLHQMKNILFINDKASMYFCTTVIILDQALALLIVEQESKKFILLGVWRYLRSILLWFISVMIRYSNCCVRWCLP